MSAIPAVILLVLQASQGDGFEGLIELRAKIRERRAEAAALLKAAHEALDRGEYEAAADRHRRSRRAEADAKELSQKEGTRVERIAEALVHELNDDGVEIRDRASARLVALGPGAIPILERALGRAGAESQARLRDVLGRLKGLEMDSEGRAHQWAVSATASSQYSDTDWSALQATGKPDTNADGDQSTAWASREPDGGEEWLELTYDQPVRPSQVRIHETYNPGAVIKVEAKDSQGKWHVLWQGRDTNRESPGWFSVPFERVSIATRTIRITLDSAGVAGWNEVDAVELIGDPGP